MSLKSCLVSIYSAIIRYINRLISIFRTFKTNPENLIEPPIEEERDPNRPLTKDIVNLHKYFTDLGRKYGPLFRVTLGERTIMVLNDFATIEKALKENGEAFSGKWKWKKKSNKLSTLESENLSTHEDVWIKQRSLVISVLQDFVLGKSRSLKIIQEECLLLLKNIEKSRGGCIEFSNLISHYTANIIAKFIFNKRFSKDDPTLNLIKELMSLTVKEKDRVQQNDLIYSMAFRCYLMSEYSFNFFISEEIDNFFRCEIEKHSKELNLKSEGQDLIDFFLIKKHQLTLTEEDIRYFDDWNLILSSTEFLSAGLSTTSTTLMWSFMFMSRYPDIQTRVYNEILDQIGNERRPTMNDKEFLQYTQAVMDEILRLSSNVTLDVIHKTLKDCKIKNYSIPRGTLVFPNLFACHRDPKIWKKPNEFYPEHFLTKDNNGVMKYTPREQLIPFGIGPIQCLGESLARTEFFIFFTSILQTFHVSFVEQVSYLKYQKILRGNEAFLRSSSVDKFAFRKRFTK